MAVESFRIVRGYEDDLRQFELLLSRQINLCVVAPNHFDCPESRHPRHRLIYEDEAYGYF